MEKNIKTLLLEEEFINEKRADLEGDITEILSRSEEEILSFFSDYTYWNGVFAGCVINLASRFHLGLRYGNYSFNSPEEDFFQMKGHKVAGLIFAAAEDEYADENCQEENVRVAHKDMAWFMLNEMFSFYKRDISSRRVHGWMNQIVNDTAIGYGVDELSDFMNLAWHLGFHIGSEKVASFEFGILADKMKELQPELTSHLKGKEMVKGISAFSWIEVHGPVEDVHANYALDAAQIIIDYLGTRDKGLQEEFIANLQEGFWNFSGHQQLFFKKWLNPTEVSIRGRNNVLK